MKVETLIVGPLQTNCYLISGDESNEVIVIDPAGDGEKILSAITKWYKNDGVIYECYDAFNNLSPSRLSKNRYNFFPESFDSELRVRRDDFHTACAVIALIMSEIK